jgi:hypothetical protein
LQASKHQTSEEKTAASKKYEPLFDGTLCNLKTKPVFFQLREGATSYHGQAFSVPKIHKGVLSEFNP